jgi:N-acetylglucosamine kinase-like BadF-type ATPase
MTSSILIADNGGTKCEWCLVDNGKTKKFNTVGLSLYFLTANQVEDIIEKEVITRLKHLRPARLFFYGTGLGNKGNMQAMKIVLAKKFPKTIICADTDMLGAARALSGSDKGNICILGTGSNCCYYDGNKIKTNYPGLGYVLGDEGSGAYMGRKVIQHYLYNIFDEALKESFCSTFQLTKEEILEGVYKKEKPNYFLASFASFLLAHRGHYLIENIIEDALNDFFLLHLSRLKETRKYPTHFTGSVAYFFKDKIKELCNNYGMHMGKISQKPMSGLLSFHNK